MIVEDHEIVETFRRTTAEHLVGDEDLLSAIEQLGLLADEGFRIGVIATSVMMHRRALNKISDAMRTIYDQEAEVFNDATTEVINRIREAAGLEPYPEKEGDL